MRRDRNRVYKKKRLRLVRSLVTVIQTRTTREQVRPHRRTKSKEANSCLSLGVLALFLYSPLKIREFIPDHGYR